MEGRVVQGLRLPELILALDIGNRTTGFIVLDDARCAIQRVFAGEDILK